MWKFGIQDHEIWVRKVMEAVVNWRQSCACLITPHLSAVYLSVHLLSFDLSESHAGKIHCFYHKKEEKKLLWMFFFYINYHHFTGFLCTTFDNCKNINLKEFTHIKGRIVLQWRAHLYPQSGTSQTLWKPPQRLWPAWRPGTLAASAADCRCPCLLLPWEDKKQNDKIFSRKKNLFWDLLVQRHSGNGGSPWRQQQAALCWLLSHASTPSAPQTSLCPAPPGQPHHCNTNKKKDF